MRPKSATATAGWQAVEGHLMSSGVTCRPWLIAFRTGVLARVHGSAILVAHRQGVRSINSNSDA